MSYWSNRQKQLHRQAEKDEEALKKKLASYYDREQRKLEKEIAPFYRLYGEGDVVEYRKLMETLSDADIKLLMEKMDAFALKYPEYSYLLPVRENIYKLNHLEGLEYSIRTQQLEIGAINQQEMEKHLAKLATRSANASMEMMGFGRNFYAVNADIIQALINKKWIDGKNFSDRIWGNADKLANYLVNDAAVGFASGKPYAKMVAELTERFRKVSKNDAYRLVYTEGTYVMAEAGMQPFEEAFDEYKISTAGDGKVCRICRDVASAGPFRIVDRVPGENFPPFHSWCRCSFEIVVADWDVWAREYDKKHLKGGAEIVKRLRNGEKSGILNILVDELTPCLRRTHDSQIIKTRIEPVDPRKRDFSNWEFDWGTASGAGNKVVALYAAGDDRVQGLLSYRVDSKNSAVQVSIVESAPFNNPHNPLFVKKEYEGVGAHLFAEAARISVENGFEGYVYFDAKTKLIEHYESTLGAIHIGGSRMYINDSAAAELIRRYYGN